MYVVSQNKLTMTNNFSHAHCGIERDKGKKKRKHMKKRQELNSSETSCDKDERCRGYFVITGMGKENS
jgi:hypothetical protein